MSRAAVARRQGRPNTPTATESGRARTGPGPAGERAKTPPDLARSPRAAIIRVSGSACGASASRRPTLQGQIPAVVRAAGRARQPEPLGSVGAARLAWDADGLAAAELDLEPARGGRRRPRAEQRRVSLNPIVFCLRPVASHTSCTPGATSAVAKYRNRTPVARHKAIPAFADDGIIVTICQGPRIKLFALE